MTNPDTWWDDTAPPTKTRDDGSDLFEADLGNTALVHSKEPATSSEDMALLQAAQFAGPRDLGQMLTEAKRVGTMLGSAAFYSWRAAGSTVEGASIQLAYALAQVWGRCRTTVIVFEEQGERVKLRGRYVDLLTVAVTERDYISHLSPPPGKFAKKRDQAERWRVMQLQSAASKAVRGAILGGLPSWLVQAALDAAKQQAHRVATGGEPLPVARRKAIDALATLGLREAELVDLYGPTDLWAAAELSELRSLYKGIKDGEISVERIRAELGQQAPTTTPSKPTSNRMASLGLQAPQERQTTSRASSKSSEPAAASDVPKDGTMTDPGTVVRNDEGGFDRAQLVRAITGMESDLPYQSIKRIKKKIEVDGRKAAHNLEADDLQRYHDALIEEMTLLDEANAAEAGEE
jgi:hypothetical protein